MALASTFSGGVGLSWAKHVFTGALNGTTPVDQAITLTQPVKQSSFYAEILTGGTDTQTITFGLRPSTVAAGTAITQSGGRFVSGSGVVGNTTDGPTGVLQKVALGTAFIPPGDYTIFVVSSGASTAAFSLTFAALYGP